MGVHDECLLPSVEPLTLSGGGARPHPPTGRDGRITDHSIPPGKGSEREIYGASRIFCRVVQTGKPIVGRVIRTVEMYHGDYLNNLPDL